MFRVVDELVRFCENNGVDPWVTGTMGQRLRLDEWAEQFVADVVKDTAGDLAEEAERMQNLRAMLDEKPGQKTIAINRIREVIE